MDSVQLQIKINDVYLPVFQSRASIIDLWGGRAGGRSYFISQFVVYKLIQPEPFRCAVMRNVMSDIRKSIWQEVMDRIDEWGISRSLFKIDNKELTCLYIPTKNNIFGHGFKAVSAAATAKQKSLAGITHAVIDEADENTKLDFDKLYDTVTRSLKVDKPQIIRAFNPPPKDHWLIKHYYNLEESQHKGYYMARPKNIAGFESIHATYKDNKHNLQANYIRDREQIGNPKSPTYDLPYYCINVLGLVSDGRYGRIFEGWKPITLEKFQSMRSPKFYAMDFGFSTDPDTIIEVRVAAGGKEVYVNELFYKVGNSPEELQYYMHRAGIKDRDLVIADHEGRLLAGLKKDRVVSINGKNVILRGFKNIRKQKKPAGSVLAGIKLLQSRKVFYTETSLNLIEEYQNYCWKVDNEKQVVGDPIDKYNHCIDPIRSGVYTLYGRDAKKIKRY